MVDTHPMDVEIGEVIAVVVEDTIIEEIFNIVGEAE